MPDPDLDVLTFRHSVAQLPWWVFHGTILLSLVIAGGILVALDWIVPQLEEISRPFPLIEVEIAFLVIGGLLSEVLLGHTVLLSPRGVRIQWGPFGKTAATTSGGSYIDVRRRSAGVPWRFAKNGIQHLFRCRLPPKRLREGTNLAPVFRRTEPDSVRTGQEPGRTV